MADRRGGRWLAYYWDRPIPTLEGDALTADAPADDIVFVDLDSRPAWLPANDADLAIAARWPYAIFDVATLRALALDGGEPG